MPVFDEPRIKSLEDHISLLYTLINDLKMRVLEAEKKLKLAEATQIEIDQRVIF